MSSDENKMFGDGDVGRQSPLPRELAETVKQLQMLKPSYTPDLATRTLYEAGRLTGLEEKSERAANRAPIVAGVGFLSGIAAAVLLMNSYVYQHRSIPIEPIAAAMHPMQADPSDQQPKLYSAGIDWASGVVGTASLIQYAIVQQSANGHSEVYDEHTYANDERDAIKPVLTYGQLVRGLNSGDTSLLD